MNIVLKIALLVTLIATPRTALADVIDFSSLDGSNGDQFLSVIEGDFTVTAQTGSWFEAHFNGNEVPSIFGNTDFASVVVTENTTGFFTWDAVDLDNAGGTIAGFDFQIEGSLNGQSMFVVSGTDSGIDFDTILNTADSSQPLDQLVISIESFTSSYNIDNIVVTTSSVPEPSLALAMLALVSLINSSRGSRPKR